MPWGLRGAGTCLQYVHIRSPSARRKRFPRDCSPHQSTAGSRRAATPAAGTPPPGCSRRACLQRRRFGTASAPWGSPVERRASDLSGSDTDRSCCSFRIRCRYTNHGFTATNQTFVGSWGRTWRSTGVKPVWCSPAWSPSPTWCRDRRRPDPGIPVCSGCRSRHRAAMPAEYPDCSPASPSAPYRAWITLAGPSGRAPHRTR
jgi:hypothetical protein